MARQADGPSWGERAELRLLNHDLPRVDGPDKLTGRARYTHDVRLPGMLYGRIVSCPVPHARVQADVAPARAIEGVAAAIVVEQNEIKYVGQPVAAVAAETPELAEDGARAIALTIEELPWAATREQALAEGAPAVAREGNVRQASATGDREAAEGHLMDCEAVVEATYSLPVQHHVSLETHGVVVDYKGGEEATIYASTQATFNIAGEAARILELPESKVHCIVHHMGGGFGSKFDLDVPGRIACLLAKETGRPVHLMLTRPEEFACAGNRSGSVQRMRGGTSNDGRFVALVTEAELLGGLGRGSLPGQPYIYKVEHAFTERVSVHTHTDASRAMRAPGHPQASFAIESLIDELAYAIGMDPLEFRLRNLPESEAEVYQRQLERVAQEIGWADHPHREQPGRGDGLEAVGIGFGISTWGGGGGAACEVDVKIERDGSVTASVGSQDLGTGTRTLVAAIVAEELGLELAEVEARIGDSRLGSANGSGGSTTAASLAPSVKHAAFEARAAFARHLAELMDVGPEWIAFAGGRAFDSEDTERGMSWKEACSTLPPEGLAARGTWQQHLAGRGVHGAQAAKVKVDLLTGAVQVLKMVCIQDCGLPLNRLALRSQINGGMIGALSYALFEERVIDPDLGLLMNANLDDYKVAGCGEMPEFVAIVDDEDQRQEVIGMGEPPAIPGPAAIANALHNACGVRVRDLPITPDKVLRELARRS